MRLDKFLCEMNLGTRSQVKALIKQGQITVNGSPAFSPEQKIDEAADTVCYQGKPVSYEKFSYFMLNKPAGVVSATRDNTAPAVTELLNREDRRPGLFPVGRLDKDTEGLLLLTNDGELAHRLLAPKKHVDKTYLVTPENELSGEDILRLEEGVDIGEDRPTLPGRVQRLEDGKILLTIHEGKFHQVKRMLQAVDNRVAALKRVSFGGLSLDEKLKPGEYRKLTKDEVEILHEA